MGWLTKTAAVDAVKAITGTLKTVDGMTTSEEEKAEIRKAIFLASLKSHQAIVTAEISSGTPYARAWRPTLMYAFGAIIVLQYVAAAFGADMPPIPEKMWTVIMGTTLGLGALRSVDKIAPQFTARQLRKLKKAGVDVEPAGGS